MPVILLRSPHPSGASVLITGVDHVLEKQKTLPEDAEEGVVGQDTEGRQGVVLDTLWR